MLGFSSPAPDYRSFYLKLSGGTNFHYTWSLEACNKAKLLQVSEVVLKTMFERLHFHEVTLAKKWNQPLPWKREMNILDYKGFHNNLYKVNNKWIPTL